jgi:hypothetical protein
MAQRARKKAIEQTYSSLVGLGVPLRGRKSGDAGEEPHHEYFTAGSTTQRLLSKKTARMGDEGKAVGFPKVGGFAVFEAAFLCWSSLREKSVCSQIHVRLTSKGRGSSPIRPKGRKLRPRPARASGPSFYATRVP